MDVRIHPTAVIEEGVEIGRGTVIGENADVRRGVRIGAGCVVGGKTHLARGVRIGNGVRIEPLVCVGEGVMIEPGVLIGAGTVFAGRRYPRATTADLPREGGAAEGRRPALVREGATIGAHCTVASDLEVGRFAVAGMSSVVTCSVADFHLVAGNPARPVGCVCRCGEVLLWFSDAARVEREALPCEHCGLVYAVHGGVVTERTPPESLRAA
jgi:acetyltransferase-like isoleucine patch superfamily enzyme